MLHGLDRTSVSISLWLNQLGKYRQTSTTGELRTLDSNDDEVTVAEGEDQQVVEDGLSTFLWMGSLGPTEYTNRGRALY